MVSQHKSELLVEFSLLWLSWIDISIDEVPLLVDSSMLVSDLNVSVFNINVSTDFHNLSLFIDESGVVDVSEHLPPS